MKNLKDMLSTTAFVTVLTAGLAHGAYSMNTNLETSAQNNIQTEAELETNSDLNRNTQMNNQSDTTLDMNSQSSTGMESTQSQSNTEMQTDSNIQAETNIDQALPRVVSIEELPSEENASVRLLGTVTEISDDEFTLQDETGSIDIAINGATYTPTQGEQVEVVGKVDAGFFYDSVVATEIMSSTSMQVNIEPSTQNQTNSY